jgi:hypothetical protein
MGVLVPLFAVAFNALLWTARVSLSPVVTAFAGPAMGWAAALLAPLALLAIALRLRVARAPALLFVSAVSLALVGLLSGL